MSMYLKGGSSWVEQQSEPAVRWNIAWHVLDVWQQLTDTILDKPQRDIFLASPHCRKLAIYWYMHGEDALRARGNRAMVDGVLRLEVWRRTP